MTGDCKFYVYTCKYLIYKKKQKKLGVSKLTWRIWRILTQTLWSLKTLRLKELIFIKVYNVWAKNVQRSYVWWHLRLIQNLKENWLGHSKMTWIIWQIFVHRLKKSDFILTSKMAELNQNRNSKQPDWPDTEWKLYFTLEINEYHN